MQDSGVKLGPITTLFVVGPVAGVSLAVVAAASEWNDPSFTYVDLPWLVQSSRTPPIRSSSPTHLDSGSENQRRPTSVSSV